jgi:hypothetical protein
MDVFATAPSQGELLMKRWLEKLASDHPIRLGFVIFVLVAVVVTIISLPFWRSHPYSFFENIMAEAYGLLFDLLVIGIFVTWLNRMGRHRQTIQRHFEEIDDYRDWQESEVTYRITGIIRRLNRLGVTDIDLKGVFLKEARLRGVALQGAQLQRTMLQGANLWEADLERANLWKATLQDAILWDANLRGAQLERANLQNCKLHSANLEGARLEGARLEGARLEGARLEGARLNNISYNEQTCWPAGFSPPADVTHTRSQPSPADQPAPNEQSHAAVTHKLPIEECEQ